MHLAGCEMKSMRPIIKTGQVENAETAENIIFAQNEIKRG